MKLNNKIYDVLKYVAIIGLPALAIFWKTLAPVWGWPFIDEVEITITAAAALLGALLCISNVSYKNSTTDEEAM